TVSSRRAFVLRPPATGRSFPLELLTNETTAMVASTPAPTAVPIVTPRRSAPFSHRQCVSVERHEYSNGPSFWSACPFLASTHHDVPKLAAVTTVRIVLPIATVFQPLPPSPPDTTPVVSCLISA